MLYNIMCCVVVLCFINVSFNYLNNVFLAYAKKIHKFCESRKLTCIRTCEPTFNILLQKLTSFNRCNARLF